MGKSLKSINSFDDSYIKAIRKGNREAQKEIYGDGFKTFNHIHKTSKVYSRKGKNKFQGVEFDEY